MKEKVAIDLSIWKDNSDLFNSLFNQRDYTNYTIVSNDKKLIKKFLNSYKQYVSVIYTNMDVYRFLERNEYSLYISENELERDLVKQGQLIPAINIETELKKEKGNRVFTQKLLIDIL